MGCSSRRPHRVPLLSAKNRKRRLHRTGSSIEDWEDVVWSDESLFLLRHSDGRVRIWRKEHENMDPSCLVSMVQAAGVVMVWGIFFGGTLGPLVPIEHRLNAKTSLSIVSDHVHPFRTTVYPSSDGYFQQDNAPCHKNQIISICIMDVQLTNLQQLCDAIMSTWTKISEECFQHLDESMPRIIKAVLKTKGGPTRY